MRISLFNLSAAIFLMIVVLGPWEISATETTTGAATTKRPNVLLIYTDDHAQWAVGAYGNKDVHTPEMDRLAAEGVRFTQGFTKPVCSPSRAMLLTGKYSHRLGIPDYIPYGNPVAWQRQRAPPACRREGTHQPGTRQTGKHVR